VKKRSSRGVPEAESESDLSPLYLSMINQILMKK
jgi:hypothetical protein